MKLMVDMSNALFFDPRTGTRITASEESGRPARRGSDRRMHYQR